MIEYAELVLAPVSVRERKFSGYFLSQVNQYRRKEGKSKARKQHPQEGRSGPNAVLPYCQYGTTLGCVLFYLIACDLGERLCLQYWSFGLSLDRIGSTTPSWC